MSLLLKALQQADRGSKLSLEPMQERNTDTPTPAASATPASAKAAASLMLQKQANAEKHRMLILLGALVVVVLGMAVYFYLAVFMPWVFLPKPQPVPVTPAPLVTVVPAEARPTIPGSILPALPSASVSPDPATATPATTASATLAPLLRSAPAVEPPQRPRSTAPARSANVNAGPNDQLEAGDRGIQISGANPAPTPSAGGLNSAYQSLQEGRLEEARRAYEKLRALEPRNPDILSGLGLIAQRQGRTEEAMQLYLKTLDADPKNIFAHASLTGIIARSDPAAAEARLKALLTQQPAAFLYFGLGNVYAAQGRWNEAQKAYFEAQRLESDSPDYAFNLAVSLERINQPRVALDYYQRALKLSQTKTAVFDVAQVKSRIQQLSLTK